MALPGTGAGGAQSVQVLLFFSGRERFEHAREIESRLAGTPEDAHEIRAQLWATYAAANAATPEAAAEAAAHANRAAKRAATETARLWASFATCVASLTPEQSERRAQLALEIMQSTGNPATQALAPTAYFLLLGALTELGRIADLDRALDPGGQILREHANLDDSRYAAWFRCVRATLDGRIDSAEEFADEGLRRAEAAGDPDGQSVLLGQLAVLRWMKGRASELEPMLLQARQLLPDDVIWSATLAWVWLSMGRISAARGLVRALPELREVPRDRNWLAALSILAVVVAQLQERDLAREILALLDGFSDRLASIGLGVTVWGTVARPLALLQRSLGNDEQAHDLFVKAIEVSTVAGAHAWLAEAQLELAQLLVTHPQIGPLAGDERARHIEDLLSEASATAHALQLHEVKQACTAMMVQANGATPPHSVAAVRLEQSQPKVQVFGGFVVTSLTGGVAAWQSQKARELLKMLVASRGAPVNKETVMDLLWPGEHPDKLGNRLAVALVTVRRALDPKKRMHRNTFVSVSRELIRLRIEHCDVDVEQWFERATHAMNLDGEPRMQQLAEVLAQARHPVLPEQRDAGWAERLRREVMSTAFAAAYELALTAESHGEPLRAAEAYRWILDRDSYDLRAHRGLIDAYAAVGAHGHATNAKQNYERCMSELGA